MANMKSLIEKQNDLVEKMSALTDKAEAETRALNAEEIASFNSMKAEFDALASTITKADEIRAMAVTPAEQEAVQGFEKECRAFAKVLRGEVRANMGASGNGVVIPSSIASRIIETIKDISPVVSLVDSYNVKGALSFPVYDETSDKITVAAASEFSALTSHAGTFTNVEIKGYLYGALAKVGKSLINNAAFDVVSYVVANLAEKIAEFLEGQILVGAGTTAPTGVVTACTNTVTGSVTADNLITLQLAVKQAYQAPAIWVMNSATLATCRKLKDTQGRYLLERDFANPAAWTILGKQVYLSDNMTDGVVVYGDFKGMVTNLRPGMEMQILQERFADEFAVGVVAYFEFDCNVVDNQRLAVLKSA